MTFNWANADAPWCEEMGGEVAPASQLAAYREAGEPATLRGKDKTFVVERRGGYPWADGYFNRNDDSPLPKTLSGEAATLSVRIADPIRAEAGKVRGAVLSAVLRGASDEDRFEIRLNGAVLAPAGRDPGWKDPQIFSPKAEPDSGGSFSRYRVDPAQKLLRLEYQIDPQRCLVGKNQVEIRRIPNAAGAPSGKVDLEKLEVSVRYG
jgi:hypothetical protein